MIRALSVLCLLAAAACARGDGRARAGSAGTRVYHYTDTAGVAVTTTTTRVDQEAGDWLSVRGRFWTDYVNAEQPEPGGGGDDPDADPMDPDAVSSASTTVSGGAAAQEWRFEGLLGATLKSELAGNPAAVSVVGRGGREPDYRAVSGMVHASVELLQRNLVVAAFGGYGRDRVLPVEPPPGQAEQWPATHDRVFAGATVSQVLSERTVAWAGGAVSVQRGQLSNPYRRALVRTTLFPESVPNARERYTGFVQLARHLGRGTALHLRQGVYLDSWDVQALIPEVAVVRELGSTGLISLHYRHYRQSAAYFRQTRYEGIEELMSSDPRLGRVRDHTGRLQVSWDLPRDLAISASWAVSRLEYADTDMDPVIAHVLGAALAAGY